MINSISIIYPIFNEEKRLAKTFNDINKFEKLKDFIKKEYILVNDGSTDNTLLLIIKKIKNKKNIKIISYPKNRGKGYALKKGVQQARYEWLLTTDADCSVSNFQVYNWIKKNYINNKNFIYFGSRNLPNSNVKKKNYRKFLGNIFKFFVSVFFDIKLFDTQCGFKLYKTTWAKKIFKKIITNGYMHDLEICVIAHKLNLTIIELPVKWKHIDGSKINLFTDFFKIILGLLKIKKNKYV
jgi:dolichyl-phosphate beta-glucosyltransferase